MFPPVVMFVYYGAILTDDPIWLVTLWGASGLQPLTHRWLSGATKRSFCSANSTLGHCCICWGERGRLGVIPRDEIFIFPPHTSTQTVRRRRPRSVYGMMDGQTGSSADRLTGRMTSFRLIQTEAYAYTNTHAHTHTHTRTHTHTHW